nr:hypothetical protein [Clostridium nigeriense]
MQKENENFIRKKCSKEKKTKR